MNAECLLRCTFHSLLEWLLKEVEILRGKGQHMTMVKSLGSDIRHLCM